MVSFYEHGNEPLGSIKKETTVRHTE